MGDSDLRARSRRLLDDARFLTLATQSEAGPWAATVNFVAFGSPLRLMWYSLHEARHSRDIAARPDVAATIFMTGLPDLGLDGAQLVGEAHPVEHDVAGYHQRYYELNFPDEVVRAQWQLPVEEFTGAGPRRFYVLTVDRWWLLDIERWKRDMHDTRVEVPEAAHLL